MARIKEGVPGKKPLGDPPFSPALWVPMLKCPLHWFLKMQLPVCEEDTGKQAEKLCMSHYFLIIERITVWGVVLVLAFSIYFSGTLIITYIFVF